MNGVRVGNKIWMGENLHITRFRNRFKSNGSEFDW